MHLRLRSRTIDLSRTPLVVADASSGLADPLVRVALNSENADVGLEQVRTARSTDSTVVVASDDEGLLKEGLLAGAEVVEVTERHAVAAAAIAVDQGAAVWCRVDFADESLLRCDAMLRAGRRLEQSGIPVDQIVLEITGADTVDAESTASVLRSSDRCVSLGYIVAVRLPRTTAVDVAALAALAIARGCRIFATDDTKTVRRVSDTLAAVLSASDS